MILKFIFELPLFLFLNIKTLNYNVLLLLFAFNCKFNDISLEIKILTVNFRYSTLNFKVPVYTIIIHLVIYMNFTAKFHQTCNKYPILSFFQHLKASLHKL